MSQRNTTPDTTSYVLGRGKMYFASILSNGKPSGYRFVGNVPEVTATVESENYEHFRSTQGLRTKDLDIIISQAVNWTASLENMDKENLALFFSAEVDSGYTNPAIAGFTAQTLVADGYLEHAGSASGGLWYQILNASGMPCVDIDSSKLTVTSTESSPVTLVKDTDFELDAVTGKIFFLNTAKTQAIVSANKGVTAALTADAGALAAKRYEAGNKGETNVAIMYEVINAQTDAVELVFYLHKAGVTANGDANFISDEIATLPISIAVEQNDAYDAPMSYVDLRS